MAVAGEDFAVIGCDTRLSEGYSILSRDVSKVRTVTKNCLLGCVGFHGDVLTLTKVSFTLLKYHVGESGIHSDLFNMHQLVSCRV